MEREFLNRLGELPSMLRKFAGRTPGAFASAEPFPHVVVDDLFDELLLNRVLEEFPSPKDIDWIEYDTPHERKLATKNVEQIGPLTRSLINALNSSAFIEFIEDLTGIQGLIPDPHLDGGGLHQIPPGGKLGIHSDFLVQQRLKLDRRLNLIVYLNKDWKEEYGGHLEFWKPEMKEAAKKILPVFNRLVVFSTTSTSFHGHPEPLTCPPDRTRKSIALYYYSNGRPKEETVGIRPTLFQMRPNERTTWKLRQIIKRFVPPILNDLRYFRRGGS